MLDRQKDSSSPRERLRAATRVAHARADQLFGRFDLAHPAAYRQFLSVHQQVVPLCEAALEASGVSLMFADWPCRLRSTALTEDLALLGVSSSPILKNGWRLDASAIFGMLYVLEGSRLGGVVLAKRLQTNPDPVCRDANHYLRHGEGAKLWSSFIVAMEESSEVQDDYDAVLLSALSTFELFISAAAASA